MSTSTYCKYISIVINSGLATYDDNLNLNFKSYKHVFNYFFGRSGSSINVDKSGTFKDLKQNIRSAVLLANFRQQDFIILGDSQMEQGRKLSRKESLAKNWNRNNPSYRASSINKIITSARQAGKIIGMSHSSGNKTLLNLLKNKLVQYSFQQSMYSIRGNTQMKIAFAESNLPYKGCAYSILKEGVLFHIGRFVEIL